MINYRKFELNNGLEIYFSNVLHRNDIGIYVMCRVGSNYERKRLNGMSHFLEHMCFKGTSIRTKNDIIDYFAKIGASYNAATSDDYTSYYAIAHKRHWKKLLDIIIDIYMNGSFPEKELKLEKKVVMEEMNMYDNDEDHILHTELIKLLHGDTAAGRTILGMKKNIRRFTRNNIIEFRKKFYTPSNTIIMIIGNIDNNRNDIFSIIKDNMGDIKRGKKNKPFKIKGTQRGVKVSIIYKYVAQSSLRFGFRIGKAQNRDVYKYETLVALIGGGTSSRLYKYLREDNGFCYHTSAHLEYSVHNGILTLEVGVDNTKIKETISIVMNILKDLKKNVVEKKELSFAKTLLNTQEELLLETQDDYSNYLEKYIIYNKDIEKLGVRKRKRNSVTDRQLLNLAKQTFVNDNFVFVALGPIKKSKKLLSLLRF